MQTFVIDSSNALRVFSSNRAAWESSNGTWFTTEKEFASATADWPLGRFAEVWNKLPGAKPVRKFTDRRSALTRLWAAIQALKPEAARGTKAGLIIDLLERPSGATIQEIMDATGWQAHSVRAFLSAQLPRKLGHRAKSFDREGVRAYRIRITRRKP